MSEADGGQISWDIDVSAAEETTQAVEGQANIDWDADPVADGGSSAQNIDWDIGVDENVGQEASDAAHAGKLPAPSLTMVHPRRKCAQPMCLIMGCLADRWWLLVCVIYPGKPVRQEQCVESDCHCLSAHGGTTVGHAGGIIGEMVSDGEFRSSLVNEAHELMAFLQTRLSEAGSMQILGGGHSLLEPVSSATLKHWMQVWPGSSCSCPWKLPLVSATCYDCAGSAALPRFENASAKCAGSTSTECSTLTSSILQELKCAVDHMTSERTQQLLLFQTSERYLSRVAAALQHKAGQESKFRR